jgi:hypothetical protein
MRFSKFLSLPGVSREHKRRVGRARAFGNAPGNYLSYGSSIISAAAPRPITISAWGYFLSDENQTIFNNNFNSSGPRLFVRINVGGELQLYSGSYAESNALTPILNEWIHLAWAWDTDDTVYFYRNGVAVGTDTMTVGGTATDGAAIGTLNGSIGGFDIDGRLADLAIWNGILNSTEVERLAEGYSPLEVRVRGLVSYWPLDGHDLDIVGQRHMGPSGSMAWGVGAPLLVPEARIFPVGAPAVGPTLQAVAGTLTSAGVIVKQTTTARAGTLTSAGTVTTLRTAFQAIAGTLTTSGAVTTLRTAFQAIAGTLTSTGAVIKNTATSLAGTLTSAGTLVKNTAVSVAGTLTTSGTVTTLRTAFQAIAGTLTTAGTVVKITTVSVAGYFVSRNAIQLGYCSRSKKRGRYILPGSGRNLDHFGSSSEGHFDQRCRDSNNRRSSS